MRNTNRNNLHIQKLRRDDGTIDDAKFVMTAFLEKYQSSNTCHDI